MRRLLLAAGALAAMATAMSPGTFSVFSQTRTNTATWQAQAVFPPLNTAVPTITSTTVGLVTTLTGSPGSWVTANPGSSTYELQWQRCSGGTCSDVGSPTLLSTLDHVITSADSGQTLRLKVTGADSSISAPDRASTIAYSVEVPA